MDERVIRELRTICGASAVLDEPVQLLTYECDALPHLRQMPAVVVLPASAEQVQAVVRVCAREGLPFVARGHGTGLSGGALPVPGGVVIGLARLNRVLGIDIPNRLVTVEPASPTSRLRVRSRRPATTTRPIRRASRCARSAATSPRTPAAPIA